RRQPDDPLASRREGHSDPDAVQGRSDGVDEGRRHAQGQDRGVAGRGGDHRRGLTAVQSGQVSGEAPSTSPARYREPQTTMRPAPSRRARARASVTSGAGWAPRPHPRATAARASGSAQAPSKGTVKTVAPLSLSAVKKPPASLLASI